MPRKPTGRPPGRPRIHPKYEGPPRKPGRPTSYRPELCQELLEYFDTSPVKETDVITGGKNWQRRETKLVANGFLSLEDFCWDHDIDPDAICRWCDRYPEFAEAVRRVKHKLKANLVKGALLGVYEPRFAQFVALNYTDMRNTVTYEGDITVQRLRHPGERAMLQAMATEIADRIRRGEKLGLPTSNGHSGNE